MIKKITAAFNLSGIAMMLALTFGGSGQAQTPTVQQLLDQVGIKPEGDRRGQNDIVGFASTAPQMDAVIQQSQERANTQKTILQQRYGWDDNTAFIAAVCPHDDYVYAGRLYQLLIPHIQAKRIILFGVFHKARYFNCQDRLVFDAYKTWYAPYGNVNVSSLRDEIIQRLPQADYIVNNDMQMVEHSVEAIVPWLQAYNRDVEIVSILVPYMDWGTMQRLAGDLTEVLANLCQQKGWRLGKDLAMICSADAVHYGDVDWGGKNFAPFGTDVLGYQMAVKRDLNLAENKLSGLVTDDKLKGFFYSCVDEKDVRKYLITWCGRFSIPFGLNVASRLTHTLEERPLNGFLLDYGTSISEATLEVDGIGATAPHNLHHWVGYAVLGYR